MKATPKFDGDKAVDERIHERVGVGQAVTDQAKNLVDASERTRPDVAEQELDVQGQSADGKHNHDDSQQPGCSPVMFS